MTIICYLYWRNTSTQGKGTLFMGPKTQVKPPSRGHPSTQKVTNHKKYKFKCPLVTMRQLSKHELSHLNRCTALVGSKHRILQRYVNHDFFVHWLGAWNKLQEIPRQNKRKIYFVCWWKTPGQPSLREHVAWSRGCPLNRGFSVTYPASINPNTPPPPGIPIITLQVKLLYNQYFKVSRPLIFLPFTQLPLCLENQGSSVINI